MLFFLKKEVLYPTRYTYVHYMNVTNTVTSCNNRRDKAIRTHECLFNMKCPVQTT